MKTMIRTATLVIALCGAALGPVRADTFGSETSSFEIDFVTIGNPSNAPDSTGQPDPVGSIAKLYRIGKYEVSEQMIDKANTLGGLDISKSTDGPDKPAWNVRWIDAARFVNWLNADAGSPPAYKINRGGTFQLWEPGEAGYDPSNRYRNTLAPYFLPNVDEWYKAGFFDPSVNGGAGGYWDYAIGSDVAPTPVASSNTSGSAVDSQLVGQGPADVTLAGGLSPYGTMGQRGNVYEWQETEADLTNDLTSSARMLRGGNWFSNAFELGPFYIDLGDSTGAGNLAGFRVASKNIPEPGCSALIL